MKQNKTLHITLGSLSLLVFAIISYFVKFSKGGYYLHHPLWFDAGIQNFAFSHRNGFFTSVAKALSTAFGDTGGIITAAVVFLLLLIFKKHTKIPSLVYLTVTVGLAVGLGAVLKNIFKRVRPTGHQLTIETNPSFPSGHSLFTAALVGALFLIFVATMRNTTAKFFLGLLATVVLLCVMYSRIYLGVHYPTDTVGGALLGLSIVHFGYLFYKPKALRSMKRGSHERGRNA